MTEPTYEIATRTNFLLIATNQEEGAAVEGDAEAAEEVVEEE